MIPVPRVAVLSATRCLFRRRDAWKFRCKMEHGFVSDLSIRPSLQNNRRFGGSEIDTYVPACGDAPLDSSSLSQRNKHSSGSA